MEPREWVARARELLGNIDLLDTGCMSSAALTAAIEDKADLLDTEINWRDREDDVPREVEIGRLLCEEERSALQELALGLLRSEATKNYSRLNQILVEDVWDAALEFRRCITGKSINEIKRVAWGKQDADLEEE